MEIRKYSPLEDFEALMKVIESEGEEWSAYCKESGRDKYRSSLERSITYVAYYEGVLCGYSRSICDGFEVYVFDLLVQKSFRGKGIGKRLMESTQEEFPDCDAYVLSDVDDYYTKLGYRREGSIFKIRP